jgi:SAM-dependent methyltransferase
VLDLGCGEGWLVRALAEHGIESVGVDGSPALIEAAQSAGNGTFHICSYADLVAAPQQIGNGFDVIAANFALLDADIAPLLRALRLVLALGGAIVIQILHPWTVDGEYRDGWRKEDFRSFDGIWQPMPWYFRTLEAWIREVCKCGYAVIDLREPKHPDTQAPLSLIIVAESKEG